MIDEIDTFVNLKLVLALLEVDCPRKLLFLFDYVLNAFMYVVHKYYLGRSL